MAHVTKLGDNQNYISPGRDLPEPTFKDQPWWVRPHQLVSRRGIVIATYDITLGAWVPGRIVTQVVAERLHADFSLSNRRGVQELIKLLFLHRGSAVKAMVAAATHPYGNIYGAATVALDSPGDYARAWERISSAFYGY